MKRIISLLLSLTLLLGMIPAAAAREVVTPSGSVPMIRASWEQKTARACADDGILVAAGYRDGQMTGLLQVPVQGEASLDLQPLYTGADTRVQLFLTDRDLRPLVQQTLVQEGVEPGPVTVVLPEEKSLVQGDGVRLQTGLAFPAGSTVQLEPMEPGEEITAEAPEPETALGDGFEPEGPLQPDHYVLKTNCEITVTDADGTALQPEKVDGKSELLLISMDLRGLTEDEKRTVRPMYYNPETDKWEDVAWYLDPAQEKIVILTDHLSRYGVFVQKDKSGTDGNPRYERFDRSVLDAGRITAMPPTMAEEILKIYEQYKTSGARQWTDDVLSAMDKAAGNVYFEQVGNLTDLLSKFDYEWFQCKTFQTLKNTMATLGVVGAGLSVVKSVHASGVQSADAAMSGAMLTLTIAAQAFPNLLGPAAVGASMVNRALSTIYEEVVGKRDQTVENLVRAYYRSDDGTMGGKRTLRQWKSKFNGFYWQNPNGMEKAMMDEIDRYVNQVWTVYDEPEFAAIYASGAANHGFNSWPAAGPELRETISQRYKQELMEYLTILIDHFKDKAYYRCQRAYQEQCDRLLQDLNKRIGIRITEKPFELDGKAMHGTKGGYAVFHGADKEIWSQPFNEQGVCCMDFRLKGWLSLPEPYLLDIYNAKDELIAIVKLRNYAHFDFGPGKILDVTCGPVTPSCIYTVEPEKAKDAPLLAGLCGALLDAGGKRMDQFQLDENGRAQLQMHHDLYELQNPVKLAIYGNDADRFAGERAIITMDLPGFLDHTFRLSPVGNYEITIREKHGAASMFRGCRALLRPLEQELTGEGLQKYSTILSGSGRGKITIPVELFHRDGPYVLQLFDKKVTDQDLLDKEKQPPVVYLVTLQGSGKPGEIPVELDTTPPQNNYGTFRFDDDFTGKISIYRGESATVPVYCQGEGTLETWVEAAEEPGASTEKADATVSGSGIDIRGRRPGTVRVYVSYGRKTAKIDVAVLERERPSYDGLYRIQRTYANVIDGSRFIHSDLSDAEPEYVGLRFYEDANAGGRIVKMVMYTPSYWGNPPVTYELDWYTGLLVMKKSHADNRTEYRMYGTTGESRMIYTGGDPATSNYHRVESYAIVQLVSPWYGHGDPYELNELYRIYSGKEPTFPEEEHPVSPTP